MHGTYIILSTTILQVHTTSPFHQMFVDEVHVYIYAYINAIMSKVNAASVMVFCESSD